MALGDGIVVRVVARSNLERARAELHADIIIGNDGDLAAQDRHDHFLADIFLIALIVRVDGHRGITQYRLGADRGDGDIFIFCGDGRLPVLTAYLILKVIECRFFLTVFHLQVGDGGLEARRPVDETRAAVDESFFVEAHKSLPHSAAEPGVQGEALA